MITLLCFISPQIPILIFLFLNIDLITHKSSRACVGCSFVPSPALRIGFYVFEISHEGKLFLSLIIKASGFMLIVYP